MVNPKARHRLTLADVPRQAAARIVAVERADDAALRLMEMGVVPGASAMMLGRAPLGDPIHYRVDDCELSIRREQARLVEVELLAG